MVKRLTPGINFGLAWLDPLTPKISLVILLTVCHTILLMTIGKFDILLTNNPLIDIIIMIGYNARCHWLKERAL